jgi:ribosomal protein S18 acetylase RimI-like enzyme
MADEDVPIEPLDLADGEVAAAVLALQRRAYRVEAELIGVDGIPPLTETLAELQRSGETFLGAFVDGALAAVVSWKSDGQTLDIHRLAVDPGAFRRGVGRALVRAVLAMATTERRAIVQTGEANEPAKALYRSEDFADAGTREIAPGVRASLFERPLG